MSQIVLKSIGEKDFLSLDFFIPYYQRGYRWTPRQVEELLNDIYEFGLRSDKSDGEFYCIQPLVVIRHKEDPNKWEVIDGQQRLTTLYILLTYLKDAREIIFSNSDLYNVQYETRVNSQDFLVEVGNTRELNMSNPDYYHMSQAYLTIKAWFERAGINKGKFLNPLLNTRLKDGIDPENNVRFIWYEVEALENQASNEKSVIDIFNRLNKGKIPLTNAELVKALFFIHEEKNKDEIQIKMGTEWDTMEYTLQDPAFWSFITKKPFKGSNHIEILFDLVVNKYKDSVDLVKYKGDKLYTFLVFNELVNPNNQTFVPKDDLWKDIKTMYRILLDFYNNPLFYHLIGFLIHSKTVGKDVTLAGIIALFNLDTKEKFVDSLKRIIYPHVKRDISTLSYTEDYDEITDILFLYNVLSSLESNYIRFPFDKYATEIWSLEHIHAQNTEALNKKQKKLLLESQLAFFASRNTSFIKRIKDLIETENINDAVFNQLENEIFAKYSDNIGEHSIQNLALLRKSDNSALNNNIFPIKRDFIKDLDEKGSFIPIGTKNVFMKYYSKNVEQNVMWDVSDQKEYLTEIEKTLLKYFPSFKNELNED